MNTLEEWKALAIDRGNRILELVQAANAARDEAEALRKDAERYRLLRSMTWATSPLAVATYPKESIKLGYDCPFGERLDKAIDELRLP